MIDIKIPFNEDIHIYLKKNYPKLKEYRIISKSLDCRKANAGIIPQYQYKVEFLDHESTKNPHLNKTIKVKSSARPIIIGLGPAGLFAALKLGEMGIPCILIERGERSKPRMKTIAKFWRYGELNPNSNVCFGEGGAGFFSDGKLYTRVKSRQLNYVLEKLVELGAPEYVLYYKNPHLGSNGIRKLLENITLKLESQGHEFHFNSCVEEILFKENKVTGVKLTNKTIFHGPNVILASGHSAHEIYYYLADQNVAMKQKDFAVGLRIEHKRLFMNKAQYGSFHSDPLLETARYRLSYHDHQENRGLYSFCMCPGGIVLSSGTQKNGMVVNGMSNSKHNSPWSNSALVMTIKSGIDYPQTNILDGLKYQLNLEQNAYKLSSGHKVPAQNVYDFTKKKVNIALPVSSTPSGTHPAPLHDLFPGNYHEFFCKALEKFNTNIKGFINNEALLLGVESRTSSPVTILRDKENYQSTSHSGLYPCGEGAGLAGGITSAAIDGVNTALALATTLGQ